MIVEIVYLVMSLLTALLVSVIMFQQSDMGSSRHSSGPDNIEVMLAGLMAIMVGVFWPVTLPAIFVGFAGRKLARTEGLIVYK